MIRTLALLPLLLLAGCGKPPAPSAQPPAVDAITIAAEDVPAEGIFVGRTVAGRTIEVRARVTGTITERPYTEGAKIAADAVLFRIDPREYQAALDNARAQLAHALAELAQAKADLVRIEPLAAAGAETQAERDAVATRVKAGEASVAAAVAIVTSAELSLSYTTITAPFAGLAGQAAFDPGALVSPSAGPLCVLDQVDPIAVEFSVSERDLQRWREDIDSGRVRRPASGNLELEATLLDGSRHPERGQVVFKDVRIRPETGTALIRCSFPNPQGTLNAGQFVRVRVIGAVRVGALLVPQAAVVLNPTGASVFIIRDDGTAESRAITLGAWDGKRWLVLAGLKAGERIVADGVQRVRANSPVTVRAPAAAKP